jgi:uncharacterized membrane protein YphA (DoxX/SURF4 family)
MSSDRFLRVLRWLIGLVLIWAAVGKLAHPLVFFASLLTYNLPLPESALRAVATILPWTELICGLLLLAGRLRPGALALSTALFVAFSLATGQALFRGLDISCGCLDLGPVGVRPGSSSGRLLESAGFAFGRALALAIASGALLRRERAEGIRPMS